MLQVAINGYGRIGRSVLRALFESDHRDGIKVVAINEIADPKTVRHLTKYDSTHGILDLSVTGCDDYLEIDGNQIALSSFANPNDIPWINHGVDILFECSGSYSDRETAGIHLNQGAGKLLFSQPADPNVDATVVYGVNQRVLEAQHEIVSAASCTTNCILPVIKVLEDSFGIEAGTITTIHSAMNDQPLLDTHNSLDLRKSRAATASIIPVDTALATGIGRIIPRMADRFTAQALRVPTLNVSAMDLTIQIKRKASVKSVNQALNEAAQLSLSGVLGYNDAPLVSCDFNHDSRSGVIDGQQTRVAGGNLVKVLTWFDNEWGFANRMLDVAEYWSSIDRGGEKI